MTKLQSAIHADDELTNQLQDQTIQFNLHREVGTFTRSDSKNDDDERDISSSDVDTSLDDEPLGYQHFLCDFHIEYNLGGNRASSACDKYCFKLKYLPYMVEKQVNKLSINELDNSSQDKNVTNNKYHAHDRDTESRLVDVTKTTCAFLGNSDYVPNVKSRRRRVVLELISAKLSQSSTYIVPPGSNVTNPTSLTENTHLDSSSSSTSSPSLNRTSNNNKGVVESRPTSQVSAGPSPSSKRFVNYTILIKTAPGLDKSPGVIERRFSDFLSLYQGLRCHEAFAKIVDKHVTFPKKIYMGNFSLTKIAERSIEFTRLLNLCMSEIHLLWSVPFVSFLLDRELKDAHRLSLFGDPDDVQALLENAYYIEQKIYMTDVRKTFSTRGSSCTLDLSGNDHDPHSPSLPNGGPNMVQSSGNETISTEMECNTVVDDAQTQQESNTALEDNGSSSIQSSSDARENHLDYPPTRDTIDLTPINQRILVTFCMLFIVYHRGRNFHELKNVIEEFSKLISSQEYVDSLINTRHYATLRACLLFLMNMNQGDVVDENMRLWLKRKLEDVDGAHVETNKSLSISSSHNTFTDTTDESWSSSPRNRKRPNGADEINGQIGTRVTKRDLTSLLRDRNFCSFQDGKFSKC